jgi:hypothetical protein
VRRAIVRSQVFAIVDDIAVELKKPPMVEHDQLKNVHHLSRSSGLDSLAEAFVRQKKLCNKVKVLAELSAEAVIQNATIRTYRVREAKNS